jgi:subtilase family serine protease
MYDGTQTLCRNVQVVSVEPPPTNTPFATQTPQPTQTPLPTNTPAPTAIPDPDLDIEELFGEDVLVIPSGDTEVTGTFSVTIRNTGGPINETFSVTARVVGGATYDVATIGNLDTNQLISPDVDIPFDSPGEYTIIFTVDSDDVIDESDEANNESFFIVTVENES